MNPSARCYLLLPILILLFSYPSYSQNTELARKAVTWVFTPGSGFFAGKQDAMYFLTRADSLAIKPSSDCLKCALAPEKGKSHWYRFDLNKDGLPDLIHNGSCSPYNEVEIYFGSATGWKKAWHSGGHILEILRLQGKSFLVLGSEPLACWTAFHFQLLELPASPGPLKIADELWVDSGTFFPRIDTELQGVVLKEGAELRSEPIRFDKESPIDCYEGAKIEGNILARLKMGSKGKILTRRSDHKRGDWVFVAIEVNETLPDGGFLHSLSYQPREAKKITLMGWMDASDFGKGK